PSSPLPSSSSPLSSSIFLFNAPAPTEIYTLSLHDALPIWLSLAERILDREVPPLDIAKLAQGAAACLQVRFGELGGASPKHSDRSEEHTSELQSLTNLVCRLLLEKKKRHKHTVG